MPSPYLKSGLSHTKEYKAGYMRAWRSRKESKLRVAENNLRYWQKRVEEIKQSEG